MMGPINWGALKIPMKLDYLGRLRGLFEQGAAGPQRA